VSPENPLAGLSAEELEQRIALLSAHIDAATYRLLCMIRLYDQRQAWAAGGFRSCAHWLSFRTGVDLGAAREKVRVARALADLPRVSAAFERAELSYSKVRAITRIADADNEQDWLAVALEATASQLEKLVRGCRRAGKTEVEQAIQNHEGRYLRYHFDEQGMLVLRGRLPPEMGAMVVKALEAAGDALFSRPVNEESVSNGGDSGGCTSAGAKDVSAETSDQEHDGKAVKSGPEVGVKDNATTEQRTADALVLVSRCALDQGLHQERKLGQTPGSLADKYQVMVHVDAAVLANPAEQGRSEVGGAGGVSAETSRRLACDAGMVFITEGEEGEPLHVGRRTRKINAPLRRALYSRDRQCQFPGCTHTRFLEAHHVRHWAEGGETALENLVLCCGFHHRLMHEGGFTVEAHPLEAGSVEAGVGGGFVFRIPGGRALEQTPPPTKVEGDTARVLALQNQQAGLRITADSNHPRWDGTPVDYGYAVAALLL